MKKTKKKKESRRKPKYGMLSCVGWIYKFLWKYDKKLVFVGLTIIPINLMLTAIDLYAPSLLLRTLELSETFGYIAAVIVAIRVSCSGLGYAGRVMSRLTENMKHYVSGRLKLIRKEKLYSRDYHLQFKEEVQKLDERADEGAGINFPTSFSEMILDVLRFILFGGVISTLNPLILLLLAVGAVINYFTGIWVSKIDYNDQDVRHALNKRIGYITGDMSHDFSYAKDIRLYSMKWYLDRLLKRHLKEYNAEKRKIVDRQTLVSMVGFLVILVRDGTAYAFLISKALRGEIDAASFTLYFSAITSMSGFMEGIVGTFKGIFNGALGVSDFREFLELPNEMNHGEGIPVPTSAFSVEFKNVTYCYPLGDVNVIENVSFKIEAGEKIALVGLNGAGKTTVTMIMCGLLPPTSGDVLINGKSIKEYNYEELRGAFALVPQEYHLLPLSIAHNIASVGVDGIFDRERIISALRTAGLEEKINSLPMGIETPLNREVNRDAITLSGGETQKLLMARLIYKNAPFIILDEPTAALDPIAEDKMYRTYNEISSSSTSVFISHRLASTRFCDRIFFLDGACLAEVGTHDELIRAGGKYSELFEVQSKYYKKEESTDEE